MNCVGAGQRHVERSERNVGGAIRPSHTDGFLAEHGPNSFVTSAPVVALIAQLDLADDVVEANPKANRRDIVRNGTLPSFPMTPPAMRSTRRFSLKATLRVRLEPMVRTRATGTEVESAPARSLRQGKAAPHAPAPSTR